MNPDDLAILIECAELAPSIHNTQPWAFSIVGGTVEIRADRSRTLATLDPTGRELTISCGAAIEFAVIAARGLGWDSTIALRPDPAKPDLLAILTPGDRRTVSADERELLEAISRRYTDRGTYEPREITTEFADSLRTGVSRRGAWLRQMNHDGDRLAVVQALSEAESVEAADPAFRRELRDWLRVGHAPDGIPLSALGDVTLSGRVIDVQTRDFTGTDTQPHPGATDPPPTVEHDALLLIGTDTDTELAWIEAGRALGWLWLTLTVAGFSSQPLGQVLDIEQTRVRLARQIGVIGHVQFLFRTGTGHGTAKTGRRRATALS